jgi:hypothetical protein
MLSGYEVTCANKNQRGIITRVGGVGWSLDIREAVVKIMSAQIRLYIQVKGQFVEIGIRGDGSDSFLVLEPDGFPLHNLPDFPSC